MICAHHTVRACARFSCKTKQKTLIMANRQKNTHRGYIHTLRHKNSQQYHDLLSDFSQTKEQSISAKHASPSHHALELFHADATEPTARSLPDHVLQHILRNILAQLLRDTAQVVDADFPILVFGE